MRNNFLNISYLREGNRIQRRSYELLDRYQVFFILSSHHPILVGTIPINIDVPNSDLDIVCDFEDVEEFKHVVISHFGAFTSFYMKVKADDRIVCNFYLEEMEVEIYASSRSSVLSSGYRHMLVEDRILHLLGEDFREKIILLKQSGVKTEPAFAKLLMLQGNPYEELLKIESFTDEKIYDLAGRAGVWI